MTLITNHVDHYETLTLSQIYFDSIKSQEINILIIIRTVLLTNPNKLNT